MTFLRERGSDVLALVSTLNRREAALHRRCSARNVHAVRVAARRLRALLWSMKPWIRHGRYRCCVKILKAFATELGPLRDLDVTGPVLLTQVADGAGVSRIQRRNIESEIRHQRLERGREFRSAFNLSYRSRQLRQIRELLSDVGLFRKSASGSRMSWRTRVLRGVTHLRRKSQSVTKVDLHRIRLLVKRCRYTLEALGPDAPRKTSRRMRDLQTSLGSYCDACLTVQWLQEPQSLRDAQMRKPLLRKAQALARQRAKSALRRLRKYSD